MYRPTENAALRAFGDATDPFARAGASVDSSLSTLVEVTLKKDTNERAIGPLSDG